MASRTRRIPRPQRAALAAGAAVFAIALALVPVTSASAHDYLVDSSPKAGSTQTTPIKDVSLTFDDIVLNLSGNGSSSLVQVVGPDKRHFETGCPKIEGRVVTTPVELGPSGKYTVTWQIVSADGHVVSSSIAFDYRPSTPSTAKGSATRPSCGQVDAGAASTAPHVPTQSSPAGNLWIVILIAVIIVAIMIAAVIVLLLTSRRRSGPGEGSRRQPEDDD
jgi:methionine-rich copper-binding protein CopC